MNKMINLHLYLKKMLVSFFWMMILLLISGNSDLFAQPLPPPPLPLPFPDPLGLFGPGEEDKTQAIENIISTGMDRKPAGTPPFGLAPSGEPLWPIPEPEPAKPSATKIETAEPVSSEITSQSSSGTSSSEQHHEKINCMAARNSFEGKNISPMVKRPISSGTPSGLPGKPVAALSAKEIQALQYSFLYDLQRRAKFIYEGKNDLAAAVSCKWKLIGALHSNQIDEITFNIASKNNFPKFSLWIESVVEKDRKIAAENP
ncbi:MAG: hypothetical protein AB1403_14375 [Candidatus Riflebacteria bacterium]